MTTLEDLANETFYEIFEYFDFADVYTIFSKLNQRFFNLVTSKEWSTDIFISSISKTRFERNYNEVIKPNVNRITRLRLFNLFSTKFLFSSLDHFLMLNRLKTLVIDPIDSQDLHNLHYLKDLPMLHSLILITKGSVHNQLKIYEKLFSLPVLKYCRISLEKTTVVERRLMFRNDIYSPIEYFSIDNNIYLETLCSLLPHLPNLRYLSILKNLLDTRRRNIENLPIVLNHLTHVSIEQCSISFVNWKLFVKRYFSHVQMLCISVRDDRNYLNADQWQNLITTSIPNLKTFNFQYTNSRAFFGVDHSIPIEKFRSLFWQERQWFFCCRNGNIFYSTNHFKRKTSVVINEVIDSINDIEAINYYRNTFRNINKLIFSIQPSSDYLNSIKTHLSSIISIEKLTTLSITSEEFSFIELILLLKYLKNLHTLEFNSLSIDRTKILEFQIDETFENISKTNQVKTIKINREIAPINIQFIIYVFSRMESLTIKVSQFYRQLMLECLLSKSNIRTCHLSMLCIREQYDDFIQNLLHINHLLDDYSCKMVGQDVYIWW